jgi:hypothetical protein
MAEQELEQFTFAAAGLSPAGRLEEAADQCGEFGQIGRFVM